MHRQQLKKKAQRPIFSTATNRMSTRPTSYLKTRIRGSRLLNPARILAIVELTCRLHRAYAQAYDKQASDRLLPQNTGQNPVEGQKAWNHCMDTYLPGDYPGGRNKPTGLAVGAANRASGGSTNDAALTLAIIAKESGFDPAPKNDHGPMQLTSWVSNYAKNHNLDIIVAGAYDSFGRTGKNRDRAFTGDYDANVMSGANWIRYQRDGLKMSDWQIAHGWGPGPTADIRKAYANDAIGLRDMYAKFVNCLKTGQ